MNAQYLKYGIIAAGAAPFVMAHFGKGKAAVVTALAAGALDIYYEGSSGGAAQFQFPSRRLESAQALIVTGVYALALGLAITHPNHALLIGAATTGGIIIYAMTSIKT